MNSEARARELVSASLSGTSAAYAGANEQIRDLYQKHEGARAEIDLQDQEIHQLKELYGNATIALKQATARVAAMRERCAARAEHFFDRGDPQTSEPSDIPAWEHGTMIAAAIRALDEKEGE